MRKFLVTTFILALSSPAAAEPTILSCTFNHKTTYVWTYILDLSKKLMVLSRRNDLQTGADIPLTESEDEIKWTAYINNGRDPVHYTLDRTTLRLKLVNTFDNNYTYFYDCDVTKKQL